MNITVILYVLMILAGVVFIGLAVLQALKARRAANWPTVQGVVVESHVEAVRRRSENRISTSYYPRVTYQYRVNLQEYTGKQIGFGAESTSSGKAERVRAQYAQGAPVTVFYDPEDPAKAVLEAKAKNFWSYLFLGVVLLAAGLAAAWVL